MFVLVCQRVFVIFCVVTIFVSKFMIEQNNAQQVGKLKQTNQSHQVKPLSDLELEKLADSFSLDRKSWNHHGMASHLQENDSTERHIRFTLDLMQGVFSSLSYSAKTKSLESFLISPLSIQMVLMMMHAGARGQTSRELANCLQLINSAHQTGTSTGSHELFGAAMRNLLRDPTVTRSLSSANQIFYQKNLTLSPQYERAMKNWYNADINPVDFQNQQSTDTSKRSNNPHKVRHQDQQHDKQNQHLVSEQGNNIQQMINDWVERQTRGKIANFLTAPVPTSTLLMAINVLFFKGDWQYKFDPSDTETDSTFTQADGKTVKTPMMVNRLPLAFAHDPQMKTSVIEIPYKAQRLGLFLMLPDEISGIYNLMQQLNSTSFANMISSMRKPSTMPNEQGYGGVNVRVPKFSIDSSPRISQILSQQLGLKTLFASDTADLSGMFTHAPPSSPPPQVGLDELLHKAVLQVHEHGSVAAASSATIVERVGLFNGNYFEADHPFLLFLMDKQTGLVLFSGVYAGSNSTASNLS